MTKYKVAYVDESDIDVRRFQRFSYNHFDVTIIPPLPLLEDTSDLVIESHVDALVADFDLSEQNSAIHYNGTDLVSSILGKMEGFPVFILTSFEDDAISKGEDVNIVYEKKEMDQGEKLLDRIRIQIDKYKHKLERDENRLLELLLDGQNRNLNAFEIEEIAELDQRIEKALDGESRIPNELRQSKDTRKLSELLTKVDMLAQKLRKSHDSDSI
ncbi:hypothetical protein [Dyadobacter arcticus]|uniref:Response regulator n=1 Tax=Dyadobacter arcticus TaxID=1078754 RepID=A0ABX0UQP6_9BACT|nr:hypothetical protein [Dyadobacter arcticus]NIJ54015.1 hypothetical protein [Dyadobacter arcticus]